VTDPLTEWLRVMLDEIARKRQDAERAAAEARTRTEEARTPSRGREREMGEQRGS
jgi:hypothetical protein